jgi:Reverse transcriptase (RNA-dependent DNA polymerase)
VDFTSHYSPVLYNTSFRVIILILQKMKLPVWSIDVETAFLNGDLIEEIFMKVSDGFKWIHGEKGPNGKVLRLNKSIYGMVQASRQ